MEWGGAAAERLTILGWRCGPADPLGAPRRGLAGPGAEHLALRDGIGIEPVGAMGAAGGLADGVEARHARLAMAVDDHAAHEEVRLGREDHRHLAEIELALGEVFPGRGCCAPSRRRRAG